MKRFSEQFHKKAQSVTMQSVERDELRARIVSYMEYHPMEQATTTSLATASRVKLLQTDAFQSVQIPTSKLFRFSAIFTVLVLVIVPVLAEQSVPGDSLYAIKVEFNEEVRSSLAFTPHQKIEWETERLNRRVAEAKLLASEGRLTEEVELEIAAAVKEHTEEVQKEIEVLRAEDADQATLAAIELSTTLKLQSASLQESDTVLLATAVGEVSSEQSTKFVLDVIQESLSVQESQLETSTLPAYDKIMARVEQNTTRAYELLQSLGLSQDDQLYRDLDRRLSDIGRSIDATAETREGSEVMAGEQLLTVLERTQKLIVYMSDIEGNRSIALETIVPIILTPEEEVAEFERLRAVVQRNSEILSLAVPSLGPGVAEKVTYAVDLASSYTQTTSSTTKNLASIKETVAVLDDALKLIAAEGVDITAEPIPEQPEPSATTTSNATTTELLSQ